MSLWGNEVNPHAVRQGILGDCWFLGTLSALGEWENRAHRLISKADQAQGIYEMTLFNQAKPQRVTIDDSLPMIKQYQNGLNYGKQNSFAKQGANQGWWAALVEKAAAKFYGNYENLRGGTFI